MNRRDIEAKFGLHELQSEELLERMFEALMDEGIEPELKARMQQYVRSHADDSALEAAVIRYAEKLKPYEGKLEGASLVRYNKLAARLGLKSVLSNPSAPSAPEHKTKPLRPSRLVRISMRVAAVLIPAALVVGGWLFMNRSPYEAEFTIASADHIQTVFLPDSTRISVEAGSSAFYHETSDSRDVELTGDAFFDVKQDTLKPFHVSTSHIRLTVLGTEFAVSGKTNTVSLYEGSVSVDAGATSNTLSWGERLIYDSATGAVDVSIIPAKEMMAEGYKPRLVFDRSTLGEVLDALAASFDTEIVTASGVNRNGGSLTLNLENMPLTEAVGFLIKITREDLSFSSTDGVLTITKNN